MPTTKWVEIIRKKEFAIAAIDVDNKTFVVYVVALAELIIISIYLFCKAKVALLIIIEIYIKYFNFLNIFFLDSAAKLLEYTRINNYLINLLENKQLPYDLIYSLGPMKLKMLKIYIKANVVSGFIKPS